LISQYNEVYCLKRKINTDEVNCFDIKGGKALEICVKNYSATFNLELHKSQKTTLLTHRVLIAN